MLSRYCANNIKWIFRSIDDRQWITYESAAVRPEDAQKAGFAPTITPFNGEHHAGLQVLNSSNFPDNAGPLFHVKSAP
jgi:hypothetical protein